MPRHAPPWHAAVKIGAIYLALSVAWILLSDRAVGILFPDPAAQATAQTLKGIFFVLVSAMVVAGLILRELRRLRRLETRYQALVDQWLAGIYAAREGRLLFANPQFAEIFGKDPEALDDSLTLEALVVPEDRAALRRYLARKEKGEGGHLPQRVTGVRADGSQVRIELHGRAVDWDGQPAVVGLVFDVTEQERLEQRMQQSQRLEAIGQLTGTVVHDFNNFLTTIIAPLEMARDLIGPGHPARQELAEARENAHRAARLTRQLLAFSRERAYQPRPIDLNDLLLRARPLLDRIAGDRFEVTFELTPDTLPVEIDPERFEQVLVNLVVNAKEAGGGTGRALIRSSGEGGVESKVVVLSVIDDGPGMDADTVREAIEPFFTTKPEGTGLGLATVHGIVTQGGGELKIESEPGEGTTVSIRLPRGARPPEPLLSGAAPLPRPDPSLPVSGRGVVLIVDDEAAVRRIVSRALQREGFQTLEAGSATRALELAGERGREIDIALVDLGLPDMDGAALAARIDDVCPGMSVIYMSGRSNAEVMVRIAREARRRFVEKPFDIATLVAEVDAAVAEGGRSVGPRSA
jgi:two-component system, cell cycle sensor histidine kinase and response regulator CckA